jgi:hypothetical protein
MAIKINSEHFEPDERFLTDAILDLQRGLTTYVYTEYILDKLKQIFSDLEIRRNEFYWTVSNKEKQIVQPITGRPRKLEIR